MVELVSVIRWMYAVGFAVAAVGFVCLLWIRPVGERDSRGVRWRQASLVVMLMVAASSAAEQAALGLPGGWRLFAGIFGCVVSLIALGISAVEYCRRTR